MAQKRREILAIAAKLISGDRQETHGDAGEAYSLAYTMFLAYKAKTTTEMPAHDAMMFLVFVKIARIAVGADYQEDNYIDIAGYVALMAEEAAK